MLLSIKFRFLNPSFFFLDEVDVCPWKISFKCHKFEGDYCKDYAERRHQRDEWAWWVDHGWNDKKWHHTDFYGLWGGFQVLLIPSKFWIIPDRDHYISTFFLDHVANLITVDYWVLQHTISSNPPFSLSFIHQKDVAGLTNSCSMILADWLVLIRWCWFTQEPPVLVCLQHLWSANRLSFFGSNND